jgi:hypothetical protein
MLGPQVPRQPAAVILVTKSGPALIARRQFDQSKKKNLSELLAPGCNAF